MTAWPGCEGLDAWGIFSAALLRAERDRELAEREVVFDALANLPQLRVEADMTGVTGVTIVRQDGSPLTAEDKKAIETEYDAAKARRAERLAEAERLDEARKERQKAERQAAYDAAAAPYREARRQKWLAKQKRA